MNSPVLRQFEIFFATRELPSIGPVSRAGRASFSELNQKLDEAFHREKIEAEKAQLLRCLVLLWHDYLEESHALSQEIHSADGSFLHGIMHRREPDFFNAKYWFDRVGIHPAFSEIATRATQLLRKENETNLFNEIVQAGKWKPNAFVDACERSAKAFAPSIKVLQQVQEIEFRVLLEHFCEGVK